MGKVLQVHGAHEAGVEAHGVGHLALSIHRQLLHQLQGADDVGVEGVGQVELRRPEAGHVGRLGDDEGLAGAQGAGVQATVGPLRDEHQVEGDGLRKEERDGNLGKVLSGLTSSRSTALSRSLTCIRSDTLSACFGLPGRCWGL